MAKTYFGKVCAKHPELGGERLENNRCCTECERERWRKYYSENRAAVALRRRMNYEKNREARVEYSKSYYVKNLDAQRERARRYSQERRKDSAVCEHIRQLQRDRYATCPWYRAECLMLAAGRRAWMEDCMKDWAEQDWIRANFMYLEAVTKTQNTGVEWHVDHIVPRAKGGLHHPDNMQVILATKNLSKGAKEIHPILSKVF